MKEQQLNDLSIFALRELARRTGVTSPTSKRKNELIDEIIAIREGRQQPSTSSTRQGRPPKNFMFNLDSVSEQNDKVFILKQNEQNEELVAESVCGYVEKFNNSVGFLWVKNADKFQTFFMPVTAFSGNVLGGDYVSVKMINNGEGTVVKEVVEINGIDVKNYKNRVMYEELEHQLANENMHFENINYADLDIKFGENVYFYGSNNNFNTETIINVLNDCNADAKIYINLAMIDKNKIYLKNISNAELFISSILDDLDYSKRLVGLAIERAKRLMEQGKNVVIAVDDMLTLLSVDAVALKHLISITKSTDKGSISILAVMTDNKNLTILEKLADKRFNVTKDALIEF